jgi:hypothetical protein
MVAAKDFLLIDGARYAYDRDSFRAFSLPLDIPDLKAKRRLAPFVSAELVGFQGGIASTLLDDEGTGVSALLGFEPDVDSAGSATSSLRVAHQLQAAHSAAGSGILLPLVADHGYAFAGEQGSDRVLHSSDGVTWTPVSTGSGSTAGVAALAAMHVAGPTGGGGPYRRAWASFLDNQKVYRSDDHGATWTKELDFTDAALPGGGTAAGVADAVTVLFAFRDIGLTFAVGENYGDDYGKATVGKAASISSSAADIVGFMDEQYCRAGAMVGQVMWLAGADLLDPLNCSLYTVGLADHLGEPQKVTHLQGNYFTAATEHLGDTYWGGATRGELYRCDGASLSPVRTFPTTKAIRGLASWRGSLYVAIYNDSAGRLEVWRMDADGRWTVPHYAAATLDAAGQLVNFTDALYVASGQSTTGKVYRVSATDRNTDAAFTTPDVALGAPTLPKRWRRFAVQHSALGIGQFVSVEYSTDGGSAWGGTITNRDVGATETAFELGGGVLAPLARFRVSYAGGAADAFTVRSAVADALPAPDSREVWSADLRLRPRNNGAWADGTADTTDALRKHAILRDLQGETFQVVSPLQGSAGYPDRAFLASLDPGVPLEWRMVEGHPGGTSDVELIVPVRLVQASTPSNLLENASFERGTTGWTLGGTVASAGTATTLTTPDGTVALRLVFGGTASYGGVYQIVSGLVPGRYYTVSGYMARSSTGAGTVSIGAYDAAGVTRYAYGAAPLGPGTDAALVRTQGSFLLPASSGGSVLVFAEGEGTPAGTAYFDALMLEEGAPASDFRERGA